jgi:hypothetical protein
LADFAMALPAEDFRQDLSFSFTRRLGILQTVKRARS